MTHKIINTGDYLLIVDDSEIKNYYYDFFINKLKHSNGAEYAKSDIAKQVIAHLPLNNSPILEGVDLLPSLEDDVEKLAEEWFQSANTERWGGEKLGFVNGYNKAKEKYKYTEKDMHKIREMLVQGALTNMSCSSAIVELDKIIQQPKMPVEFNCEVKQKSVNGSIPVNQEWEYEPKTTTNPQGLTQWVGEYIY